MSRKTARNLGKKADPARKFRAEQNRLARIDRAFDSYIPNRDQRLPFVDRREERAFRKRIRTGKEVVR